MEGTKRTLLGPRKKSKRKNRRFVRNIVNYLKSDGYLFAPLFSNSPPLAPQIQMHPPFNSESENADDVSIAVFEVLGLESVNKKKSRVSDKAKEYLKSDFHMYGPISSPPKLGSSLKDSAGKLQSTNLVTMEVSTSTTTIREDTNHRNLRSDIAERKDQLSQTSSGLFRWTTNWTKP